MSLTNTDRTEDANTASSKAFWLNSGAGESYDRQFQNLIGWYIDQSESAPVLRFAKDLHGQKILDVGFGEP